MKREKIVDLALKGEACILTVDPNSNELTDLYIRDTELWRYLLERFGGNRMMVTLRGPHDYRRGMRMPPDVIVQKLAEWLAEDGTLEAVSDIVTDIIADP